MGFYAGIFLCSFSTLAFEIALTRIFSVSLWYHFAFMVISIGMLGIGLSGTMQSLYPGLRARSRLGLYAFFLGVSIPLGYVLTNIIPFDPVRLAWDRVQVLYIFLYYLVLSVPFFFFGMVVSTAFSTASGQSGHVYGADLLGAGCGAVASIFLMGRTGPGDAVFIIAIAALLASFIMGRRLLPLTAAILALLVLLAGPGLIRIRMSPYKELQQALKYPGAKLMKTYRSGFARVDIFNSPMARYAPGLSLEYLEGLPPQLGLTVDGSRITAITEPRMGEMAFLRHIPAALPYEMGNRVSALAVDPKGGLPVLLAREYGVGNILSVESDPMVVEAIRKDYAGFSGGIYNRNTWTGLARSRLKGTSRTFDVIDLSMTGAVPSGAFGISEDYRFTVEAFEEYLSHLAPGGVLSLSLFLQPPPRTELRLLGNAVRALEEKGIQNAEDHIAAIRSWGSICIIVKASPLTLEEIEEIKDFSKRNRFDLVYYPGIDEAETNRYVRVPDAEYYRAFMDIIGPETRETFVNRYLFQISPVTDDRPFFHYYLKAENLKETYALMGDKWQYFIEEGYLLPAVLLQVTVLSLLILLLPAAARKKQRTVPGPILLYFAFLGLGFMFIEVPLVQKMILPLEHPSYAFAGVLTSILISSGAGSLLGQRYEVLRTRNAVLLLTLLVIPYGFLINTLAGYLLAFPLPLRFVLAFAMVLPVGILMGVPFPLGIRLLGEKDPALIPWAWAVNGCFSVLAPILATMLAMSLGFRGVFLLGAGMYGLAYLVLRGQSARVRS